MIGSVLSHPQRNNYQTIRQTAMPGSRLRASSAEGRQLRLLRRHVDRETVELVGQHDLTRETAGVTSLGDAKVEQVVLKVPRLPYKFTKLITHPDMTGGT
jgi:hypothetical protein